MQKGLKIDLGYKTVKSYVLFSSLFIKNYLDPSKKEKKCPCLHHCLSLMNLAMLWSERLRYECEMF